MFLTAGINPNSLRYSLTPVSVPSSFPTLPWQLDSLGSHHLLPALSCWAPSDPLHSTLLHSTTALFDNHRSDGPETLQGAYKHGTYSKVRERDDTQIVWDPLGGMDVLCCGVCRASETGHDVCSSLVERTGNSKA